MDQVLNFLTELSENNCREWFNDHKGEYFDAKSRFEDFVNEIIKGIYSFDKSIGIQEAKGCCYRIYRDTRFSNDKTPYKTWMSAYICPSGKKSGNPGYYIHLEAPETNYVGGNILAAGIHLPDTKVQRVIREGIYNNGEEFVQALKRGEKRGFILPLELSLKKVPPPFPKDSHFSEYLKLKDFCLEKRILDKKISVEGVVEDFKESKDFIAIIMKYIHTQQR